MATLRSPAGAGFFMPPEWHPHRRTWMMWPTRAEIWPDIDAVRRAYAGVARAIRRFEPVTMAANPEDIAEATALLGPGIDVVAIPVDDSWARDAGPCFLVDRRGNRAGAAFRFNAWGGKYEPHDRDAAFATAVLEREGLEVFVSGMVAVGGGISVDGEGTILTTETCFPNENRNPGWSRDAISEELRRMLGGSHVVWLPGNAVEVDESIAALQGNGPADLMECTLALGAEVLVSSKHSTNGAEAIQTLQRTIDSGVRSASVSLKSPLLPVR